MTSKPSLKYKDYDIVLKEDFGNYPFFIDGFNTTYGFVVVKNYCNAMPGAAWFQTVKEAKKAIDDLIVVGENDFWEYRTKKEKAEAVALELLEALKVAILRLEITADSVKENVLERLHKNEQIQIEGVGETFAKINDTLRNLNITINKAEGNT